MGVTDRWREIQDQMVAAAQEIAATHGVSIRAAGFIYSRDGKQATLKFDAGEIGEGGQVITKEGAVFRQMAKLWGLSPDDLGRAFTFRRERYVIIGARPRANKQIMAQKEGQKSDRTFYAFFTEEVRKALAREPGGGGKARDIVAGKLGVGRRSEEEILRDIRDVENQLSPENLTCDGEAKRSHVIQKKRELDARMAALVKELGRKPTGAELGYDDDE